MSSLPQQNGVFPSQWIRAAIAAGVIASEPDIVPAQIQPNSLDLRIGEIGFRVQCSFLPGEEGLQHKLNRFKWYNAPVPDEGLVLERNQNYIFPLCERLDLPEDVYARANPKSTTGRLDVFTRLVTEQGTSFDEVPAGYRGRLYLEVAPRSFAIRVRQGDSLAQIRFQTGAPHLTDAETIALLETDAIILGADLRTLRPGDIPISTGLTLSISLPKRNTTVGFLARRNTPPIDLRAIGGARVSHYWDRIYGDSKPIILEPEEFYIFASRELVRLPPAYCAEMVPFDASSGEVRTHYAGFFDSGFGYAPEGAADANAAAVVLEVRSRDVPFLIEDGQPLFRLNLMRNTEPPDFLYGAQAGSNYQSQRLRLSKQFTGVVEEETDGAQPRLDFSIREG
ncbi:MAG TPA: 2'-deoxycytidine 5'-triphosphate deaminase [Chthonomonadaceae bacterium]|nr:2'-deoxycytidine 5'-triphosphate deaminase [Chthonomonadaceae bacterium]